MSDRVYIVTEEDGDYDDHREWVAGVFTDRDEARAFQAERRCDRDIETWTTGADGKQQMREMHFARHAGKFDYGVNPPEAHWFTNFPSTEEVDESESVSDRDRGDGKSFIVRGGWTREEAARRLDEALSEFDKSNFEPVPEAYRWPKPSYNLTDLQNMRSDMWAIR